jgi:hypothetical protein
MKIGSFGAGGGPGTLHKGRLQPRCSGFQPVGPALACALVVFRTQAGPRDQIAGASKAIHFDADFRNDHLGGERTYARNRLQQFNGGAKVLVVIFYFLVDAGDSLIEGVDLIEVQLKSLSVNW